MAYIVNDTRFYVDIKFQRSIQVDSIKNEAFVLKRRETPDDVVVTDPFKGISISGDYDMLRRTLRLTYRELSAMTEADYELSFDGLKDALGRDVDDLDPIEYEYSYDNSIIDPPPVEENPGDGFTYIDHSVSAAPFIEAETINASNPDFYITKTTPDNGEIFIDPAHNSGRIIIFFSSRPSSIYVNEQYFKVQRKKIGFPISRWEDIDARIKLDSARPIVHIAIPSIDTEDQDSNQYEIDGLDYFESMYKYRVKISAEVGKS